MERLNNVISDYDHELQRLLHGHETTRGPTSKSKFKTIRRNEIKDKYLNGSISALELLDEISQTIGHDSFNACKRTIGASRIYIINHLSDISTDGEEELNCDHCPRILHFYMTNTYMKDFLENVLLVY